MREEVFGSACGGFGVGLARVGEVGAEVGEGGKGGGEEGKGEVMRGIGEDGWGEKGKVGDRRGSAGGH